MQFVVVDFSYYLVAIVSSSSLVTSITLYS
jgi:hypothetical protein